MRLVADLHIHSKFSRATSRDMTLDIMAHWAKVKGITLLATGDFTHPEWLFLTKEKLEPMGNGFFRLKNFLSGERLSPRRPLLVRTMSPSSCPRRSASSIPRKAKSARSISSSSPPISSPWTRSTTGSPGSAISGPTAGPFWGWTPGISSRSWPTSAPAVSSFLRTSGRPGFRSSGPTPASTPSRNVLRK